MNRLRFQHSTFSRLWRASAVLAALVALWLVVVALGAAAHGLVVHVFYLPVLLAAFWFGRNAAIATGVLAAVAAGPLMPYEVIDPGHRAQESLYHLAFFAFFGGLAGWLVDRNHARSVNLRRQYAGTLRGFLRALEHKDVETTEHCERVARNTMQVGKQLSLPRGTVEALYWAGYLHDLGKLATPQHILSKPGTLTKDEYEVVKRHTVIGGDLLRHASSAFRRIAEGVIHHHEWWDGSGYPDGLAGEDIPLFGRIVGIVDVFEALTSDRPYRPALSRDVAAGIVREGVGSQFDPRVAEAFFALLEEGRLHVQGHPDDSVAHAQPPEMFNPEPLDAYHQWGVVRPEA